MRKILHALLALCFLSSSVAYAGVDPVARGLAVQAKNGGCYTLSTGTTQVSHTGDTLEFTFDTITLPPGAMGPNGSVQVEAVFTHTVNTNTKTPRIRFGGTQIAGQAVTASTATSFFGNRVVNRNAQNSQVFFPTGLVANYVAGTTAAVGTSAVDTSQPTPITITGQLGTGTDTISREWYRVTVCPHN